MMMIIKKLSLNIWTLLQNPAMNGSLYYDKR